MVLYILLLYTSRVVYKKYIIINHNKLMKWLSNLSKNKTSKMYFSVKINIINN